MILRERLLQLSFLFWDDASACRTHWRKCPSTLKRSVCISIPFICSHHVPDTKLGAYSSHSVLTRHSRQICCYPHYINERQRLREGSSQSQIASSSSASGSEKPSSPPSLLSWKKSHTFSKNEPPSTAILSVCVNNTSSVLGNMVWQCWWVG